MSDPAPDLWLLPAKAGVEFFADAAAREARIALAPEAALVAEWLPLRANLCIAESIALVPQCRQRLSYRDAEQIALDLLGAVGYEAAAYKRDPELSREERFVTKLVCAVLLSAPSILVDRPGLQLPDTPPGPFLRRVLASLAHAFSECRVLDYAWNAPLYAPPASATSA